MTEKWLIDGYNLLHALSRKNKKIPLKDLCESLAGFASLSRTPALLVLDGHGDNQELTVYKTDYLEVVYANEATADAYIEKYLYNFKTQYKLVVVTEDISIRQMAIGSGARIRSAGEFAEEMNRLKEEMKNKIHEKNVDAHGFNRPFSDKLKRPKF